MTVVAVARALGFSPVRMSHTNKARQLTKVGEWTGGRDVGVVSPGLPPKAQQPTHRNNSTNL